MARAMPVSVMVLAIGKIRNDMATPTVAASADSVSTHRKVCEKSVKPASMAMTSSSVPMAVATTADTPRSRMTPRTR